MKRHTIRTASLWAMVLIGLLAVLGPSVRAGDAAANAPLADPPAADYLRIPGASFVPESSALSYEANLVNEVAVTGGAFRYMVAPILLPDGAKIYGADFDYYDNVAGESMLVNVYRHEPTTGGQIFLVTGLDSSEGPSGYSTIGTRSSTPLTIVDNAQYTYEVEVAWTAGSTNLRLVDVMIVCKYAE